MSQVYEVVIYLKGYQNGNFVDTLHLPFQTYEAMQTALRSLFIWQAEQIKMLTDGNGKLYVISMAQFVYATEHVERKKKE